MTYFDSLEDLTVCFVSIITDGVSYFTAGHTFNNRSVYLFLSSSSHFVMLWIDKDRQKCTYWISAYSFLWSEILNWLVILSFPNGVKSQM